jgi:hypothetical protein
MKRERRREREKDTPTLEKLMQYLHTLMCHSRKGYCGNIQTAILNTVNKLEINS